MSPQDTIEYPVYQDGGPLSASEIIDRIEKEDNNTDEKPFEEQKETIGDTLICAITCQDVKGEVHGFQEKFELKPMIKQLEDYKIRSEVDALEEISNQLEEVNDNLAEANNDIL